jgi:hypothetical protein
VPIIQPTAGGPGRCTDRGTVQRLTGSQFTDQCTTGGTNGCAG